MGWLFYTYWCWLCAWHYVKWPPPLGSHLLLLATLILCSYPQWVSWRCGLDIQFNINYTLGLLCWIVYQEQLNHQKIIYYCRDIESMYQTATLISKNRSCVPIEGHSLIYSTTVNGWPVLLVEYQFFYCCIVFERVNQFLGALLTYGIIL